MRNLQSKSRFLFLMLLNLFYHQKSHGAVKRSIDSSASFAMITDDRLPKDVIPLSYEIHFEPNYDESTFSGLIKINLKWNTDSKKISLHAHYDLNINDRKITIEGADRNISEQRDIKVLRGSRMPKKTIYVIHLKETIKEGTECLLEIPFDGNIWESPNGLFKGSYSNIIYFATYLRPNNARRLFPCFDEPAFKVPFTVSITRPKHFITIFNTALAHTKEHTSLKDHVIDYFEKTPPMSSFTFGFVSSKLIKVERHDINLKENSTLLSPPVINIWSLPERADKLKGVYEKFQLTYKSVEDYFDIPMPLSKIDVVVIPDLAIARPADNWGLLLFKETDVLQHRYYNLAQEIIYQWLGSWVTPEWWTDAHLNKALASFVASEIVIQIDGGIEFDGKYPMTSLYSVYYEFSKRYPHSRITGMKQETISHKTELIIRMLNFTLGRESFKKGLTKCIQDHQYHTFIADDLWNALTSQAVNDGNLKSQYKVADIVGPWLEYHRLPAVRVVRDYTKNTAQLQQKVYLRERPHDVPNQDKMLWWIPIIVNREDELNFSSYSPYVWMEKTSQINISNMPGDDKFIIVNQEEISPFPVNYDERNWEMLSKFLQTDIGRSLVPTYTRAKLLHDAWNLAYAGDLSFAIALNMTLFMKFERNHVVWNPVFTFIDQIGRHIDISEAHKKFETYVLILLTPLYEELGAENEMEESWKTELRALSKRFLCHAGYRPCIEEAKHAYILWQQAEKTNIEIPPPNNYLCPIFKWGSTDEWKYGLERVMNFPKTQKQSARTFLLKKLAGCPVHTEKIKLLLEKSVLDDHSNFTEIDQFLIFTSLTTGSSGYSTLFNFLSDNWLAIKNKLQNKTNLWDHLISSATGFFLTQKGYEMVDQLYVKRKGEFGSAQHIIEKSLRNIKEEARWSEDNLPVIQTWLDNFLLMNKI